MLSLSRLQSRYILLIPAPEKGRSLDVRERPSIMSFYRLKLPIWISNILSFAVTFGLFYLAWVNLASLSHPDTDHNSLFVKRVPASGGNDTSCPKVPPLGTKQNFDFQGLWIYLSNIRKYCAKNDTRIVCVNEFDDCFLTLNAVLRWTGEKSDTWRPYPANDILNRLLAWKLPLISLIAQFPRPPLSVSVEIDAIAHLLGDPIDTIASLIFTIHVCWLRARMLKDKRLGLRASEWKAIALVLQAFDECSGMPATLDIELR
jgi:hypothetical protein